jgi:predicted HTH domain antitoxin
MDMSAPRSTDDAALEALTGLISCIDASIDELQRARVRAELLLGERNAGRPWLQMVTEEARPLVVESISAVLSRLATAGHRWRREEAAALQREQVSINRIAALFGVTRQRISALLRERDSEPAA